VKVQGQRSGKAIGSDITEEMLENATQNAYTNVEFKKGDVAFRRILISITCSRGTNYTYIVVVTRLVR